MDGSTRQPSAEPEPPEPRIELPIVTLGDLVKKHPRLRPSLIEGLLRQGETMNIIAAPKVGKSWLTYGLAISIATGQPWLDTFATTPGGVLIIDNELHPETAANRLPRVAHEMMVHFADIKDKISILNLRGRLQDLHGLGAGLRQLERDRFKLVVVDAFYRACRWALTKMITAPWRSCTT